MTADADEPLVADRFVQLPIELFDLVAEGKLSKNAAWLYALLLGHVNRKRGNTKVWPSRKHLARRMRMTQTRAVDRYIDELVDAGLMDRDRRRNGEVNDTNLYTLKLTVLGGSAQESTTRRGNGDDAADGVVHSPALPSAQPSTRGSAQENKGVVHSRAPEPDEAKPHEEEPEGTELSGPTSDRSAPFGGDDETDDDADPMDDDLTDKRSKDRALFRQLTGGKLRSDGSKWSEGVYTSDAVYTALRKRKPPIVFPGSFMEYLEGKNAAGGIADWLLSEGLEPA